MARKFTIPPEQARYVVREANEVERTELEGGAGRYRRAFLGSSMVVEVTWLFTADQYNYFKAFFKGSSAGYGSKSFTMDLLVDDALELQEHTCYFLPNSVRLRRVEGLSFQVEADLEVEQIVKEEGLWDAEVVIYEEFDGNEQLYLDLLDQLSDSLNTDFPSYPVMVP